MANLLTALRLLLVAPLVFSILHAQVWPSLTALFIVVIAIISDVLDGKVARATNTASPRGMLFDHGTDFIFVTASMAALAQLGIISFLLPVVVVVAFSQYVLDSYFLFKQKNLRMSFLGRWNGVFYFGPVLIIAVSRIPGLEAFEGFFVTTCLVLSYLLTATTVASIIDRTIAPLRSSN